jgi:hypothetical protein
MTLEKKTVADKIEATEFGHIQVRVRTDVIEDGVVLGSSFHRHVIAPGNDYSAEDPKVQAICAIVHTPEVIAAYRENQNEPIA